MDCYINENDIKNFNNNLQKIKENSDIKMAVNLEPTIEEFKKVSTDILEYIKEKKRIIYGGFALQLALNQENKPIQIYKEYEKYDIEFYTYEPIIDIKELCDILYDKGYKYV